jgi:hypothetical protein
MVNDFYTFVITSAINTTQTAVDCAVRYEQTLKTIESIRTKVPGARIIMTDSSTEPLSTEQASTLAQGVDVFYPIERNLITEFFNSNMSFKGDAELYQWYEIARLLRQHNLVGRRVFKITGRYWLNDDFDIAGYSDPDLYNKYVARINEWDVSFDNFATRERVVYFETRLWSFCYSLFDEFEQLIPRLFRNMLFVDHNLEKSMFQLIDPAKIAVFKPIGVQGYTGDNGVIKIE